MTCIVAFKQDGKTWIAGDMLGSNGDTKKLIAQPKVFKNKNLFIGYTTSFRFGQVLEHAWNPPRHIAEDKSDMKYLVEDAIPSMMQCLKDSGVKEIADFGGYGDCIIVYNQKIYHMQSDNAILEYSDYESCGSGAVMANALMEWHTNGEELVDFSVMKLFSTISKLSCGVSEEYIVMDCSI